MPGMDKTGPLGTGPVGRGRVYVGRRVYFNKLEDVGEIVEEAYRCGNGKVGEDH